MKRFLLKLLAFIIVVFIFLSVLVVLSNYLISQRKDSLLEISPDIYFVFAGNSTLECAVDDKLIDHSINIAQAGEAYLYTYAKIKALLEANNHIKKVFISFSYADILMDKEITWLDSDYFMVEKVQYYNYLLSKPEKVSLLKINPRAYLKGVAKSAEKNIESILLDYLKENHSKFIPNFGGYKYLVRDKLDVDPGLSELNKQNVIQSPYQVKYLVMISELCHQKSVEMVLLYPPQYKSYIESVNKEIKRNWIDMRWSLPLDSLLNLSGLTMADSCYGDLTHLNYRGARVFSEYINKLLNSNSGI